MSHSSFGFRTAYDKHLQQYWCSTCNESQHHPKLKPGSFMCSPGIGCHADHRAPGKGSDGARYSNLHACSAACSHKAGPHQA